jgi:hypothetical protein
MIKHEPVYIHLKCGQRDKEFQLILQLMVAFKCLYNRTNATRCIYKGILMTSQRGGVYWPGKPNRLQTPI